MSCAKRNWVSPTHRRRAATSSPDSNVASCASRGADACNTVRARRLHGLGFPRRFLKRNRADSAEQVLVRPPVHAFLSRTVEQISRAVIRERDALSRARPPSRVPLHLGARGSVRPTRERSARLEHQRRDVRDELHTVAHLDEHEHRRAHPLAADDGPRAALVRTGNDSHCIVHHEWNLDAPRPREERIIDPLWNISAHVDFVRPTHGRSAARPRSLAPRAQLLQR